MTASSDWVPVAKGVETGPRERYRIKIKIHAPYTPASVRLVEEAIRFGVGVKNLVQNPFAQVKDMWTIEDVYTEPPTTSSHQEVDFPGGPNDTWEVVVVASKTDHGTPLFIAVGVILALLIGLVIVVGWNAEKFDKLGKNPGLLLGELAILAVGVVVLTHGGST